jgi:predicted nucleic-acid-binding Zn-ribbon protein
MSIVDDNPCPKCGNPCHLMAGINVPGGDRSEVYLVCWKDKMVALRRPKPEWSKLKRRK